MRVRELALRGRQELLKRIDRLSLVDGRTDPESVLQTHAPALADPASALDALQMGLPARFFAGLSDPDLMQILASRVPGERARVIARAERLLTQQFDLLGYRNLWFGEPVDWHMDPISVRRSPLMHWSELDPLDSAVVGDSKVVWELNRHQWLVHLAQAWAMTRNERYAAACVSAIDSWIEANPTGYGINWASSLEVAYRLMSWCWVATLIREARAVTGAWAMTLLAALWAHAHHVGRYLSESFSPNTHLTGEALALFYAGLLFPDFRDAARWREIGTGVLLDQLSSQVSSDGVHFELSTCYHRYTVETYLHLAILAERSGIQLPADTMTRVEQMVEFLIAVRWPNGSIPSIGDQDGGALTPLVRRSPDRAGEACAIAASVFRRADFAWAADEELSHLIWITGSRGLKVFDSLHAAPPSYPASRLFAAGGYAIMRSGWHQNSHQLIVDVGPLGCPISSGHGHADLLSVQCTAFGDPILVDAGTYCYTGDMPWRDYFRSTAAHNTVRVDQRDQACPAGPFSWRSRPRSRMIEWRSDDRIDLIDAEHDAYTHLADPVRCRRRVIFVKPDYWLIVDDVDGRSRHTIEIGFQFAAMPVTPGPSPWVRADSASGRVFWLAAFASEPISTAVECGSLAPIRGWTSSDYGIRQPAPMLVYSSVTAGQWRCLTLLLPSSDGSSSPPCISPLYDDERRPHGLRLNATGTSFLIDDLHR
jgi:hypothetical protein